MIKVSKIIIPANQTVLLVQENEAVSVLFDRAPIWAGGLSDLSNEENRINIGFMGQKQLLLAKGDTLYGYSGEFDGPRTVIMLITSQH